MAQQHSHTKSRPVREGAKKPKKWVVTQPWVTLATQCAVRFLLGAALAAGRILGNYSPFALGFVAASGSGAGGFFALMGAGLGYLVTMSLADGFRYLATAILIYAVAFAFFDLKIYATRYFMPLCAAGMAGLTGFVYLAELGWKPENVICYATEILLVFCAGRCFALVAQEDGARRERLCAALFAVGAVTISLQRVSLPFSLSLGAALAAGAVLWCARYAGAFLCTAFGLALGLCLDLAAGGGTVYAAAFGVGALLSAGAGRWGRYFSGLSFLCGVLTVTLWSFGVTESFLPFWNGALGCALFLALPLSWLEKLGRRLPMLTPETPQAVPAGAMAPPVEVKTAPPEGSVRLQEKLRHQSGAFHLLYEQLSSDLTSVTEQKLDGVALFQRASQRVCPGCVFRSGCWKRELDATQKALRGVVEGMEKRGRADPGDFPVGFSARCARVNELVNAANQEYAAFLTRRRYQLRLREGRQALCRQYERVSRLLGESARTLEEKLTPNPQGKTPLRALAGVAAGRRPGQSVSGDAGGWFRDDGERLWVVLCDGMGSGPEAARDSRFAYRLLEQFLSAGISPEVSLATLVSALGLRWECTGGFTTIDLLELDLNTGEGAVYKLGAGPTYLRRDGVLSRITSATLPAGLQQGTVPDVSRFRLRAGDLAVLVSDGVTDGSEDEWVRQQIAGFQGDSPKDLAGALLTHDAPARDDRTAIVLLMEQRGE